MPDAARRAGDRGEDLHAPTVSGAVTLADMADEIRAVVVTRHGGSDVLEVQSRPRPQPGAGQLLVEVAASGVNFIDVYRARASTRARPRSCSAASAPAGCSRSAPGVTRLRGRRPGGHRARGHRHPRRRRARRRRPGGAGARRASSPSVAAAAMLQGMTAHYLVNSTYPVHEGDAVLVHAAAGGVGQLLVQMAKAQGRAGDRHGRQRGEGRHRARGRRRRRDPLRRGRRPGRGGARPRARRRARRLRRRRPGHLRGVAGVAAPPRACSRCSARPAGRCRRSTCSGSTRPARCSSPGRRSGTTPPTRDELRWRAGDVLGAVADGTLQIAIGGRYRLDDAAQAYATSRAGAPPASC